MTAFGTAGDDGAVSVLVDLVDAGRLGHTLALALALGRTKALALGRTEALGQGRTEAPQEEGHRLSRQSFPSS